MFLRVSLKRDCSASTDANDYLLQLFLSSLHPAKESTDTILSCRICKKVIEAALPFSSCNQQIRDATEPEKANQYCS